MERGVSLLDECIQRKRRLILCSFSYVRSPQLTYSVCSNNNNNKTLHEPLNPKPFRKFFVWML